MSQLCPRCGAARLGSDAFCSKCGFQFVGSDPVVPARAVTSRVTGRQMVGAVGALIVGLALIGNLGKASPTPVAAELPSPTPASVAKATMRPTPWATVKPALAPSGAVEEAMVVRIVDGDTIVVSLGGTNRKVRYIGMDTPEEVDPNSPVEPLAAQAAAANESLVGGKTVYLERDVSETDRYDRLLRYVWLRDGATWTLVNLELVRLGLAKAISYPPDTKYDSILATVQGSAQRTLVGLWGPGASPTAVATKAPTPKPTPRPTPKPTKKPSACHPSYSPCLPIVDDLDCADVRALGKAPVEVHGPDDYRLDRDGDGLGCE
jgi:micrococcal nuclease